MALLDTVARVLTNIVSSSADGTAPPLTQLEISWATRTEATVSAQDNLYRLYEAYYQGHHADVRTMDFGEAQTRAPDGTWAGATNYCPRVVDALAERMQITGFSVTAEDWDTTAGTEAAAEYARTLWRWWTASRMDETQNVTHTQTLMMGDAYVVVDYDAGTGARDARPRFTFHSALEVLPIYDATHTIVEAFKAWDEQYVSGNNVIRTRKRLTRYRPGLIEKFASETGGITYTLWQGDIDPETGESDGGVVPWVDAAGDPLPVPIVHFRNKPLGSDFGRSELVDVIPVQDQLNRRVWNTSEAISYQGSPLRWATNVRQPQDGQGNARDFPSAPGHLLLLQPYNSDQPIAVGQWQAGNVTDLQATTDAQLRTLAAVSGTPLHLLVMEGNPPSGEALKTAEAPLVARCRNRAVTWGNCWEDVMTLAVKLENTFGTAGAAMREDVTIEAQWESFETRDDLAREQVIALRRDDISREQANRERGYNAEERAQINQEKDEETPPALRAVDAFGVPSGQPPDAQQVEA